MDVLRLDYSRMTTNPSISQSHLVATLIEMSKRHLRRHHPYKNISQAYSIMCLPLHIMSKRPSPNHSLDGGTEAQITKHVSDYIEIPICFSKDCNGLELKLRCRIDQFLVSLRPDILLICDSIRKFLFNSSSICCYSSPFQSFLRFRIRFLLFSSHSSWCG